MTNNYIISLSIWHGFQITYFMSQQFSIALIIEFVKTVNREVKENIFSPEVMPRSLECCYLTFYWHYGEGKHAESCDVGILENEDLLYWDHK